MDLISITINNRPTFVRPHATVLQACESAGVDIPRFCYHEKLSVAGNCRMCLVEVQKSPKPVVACARPVSKGRVIFTDTPLVRKAREAVLEFLLVNHPLDCPICDQGGECDLQDESVTYGADRGRYFEFKRSVEDKETGPVVKTIRTRCIHCTRCVRFSTEVAGNEVRGAFGRGEEREIGTYIHAFLQTELSGNLVDLCPVGALTSKPYAYQARSWELHRVDSIDFFDALASDIVIHTRKRTTPANLGGKVRFTSQEEILRILPRANGLYSENWISDRTRYAFDGLKNSRIVNPMAFGSKNRPQIQNWTEVLTTLSLRFTSSPNSSISFVVGSQSNLERVYSLATFAKVRGSNYLHQGYAPAALNLDFPFHYSLNRAVHSFSLNTFSSLLRVGTNIRYEASLLNTMLRREQGRRGLAFSTIGAFSTLRYSHAHQGNSLRTIGNLLENRLLYVNTRLRTSLPLLVLLGVNMFRGHYASFLQRGVSALGKLFFVKTSQDDRLGYVHSSLGSLAFAHLGLTSKKVQSNESGRLFTINQPAHSQSFFKWQDKGIVNSAQIVSLSTHFSQEEFVANKAFKQALPLTSFYERDGHVIALEGRRRKHSKAVSAPTEVRSLEAILSALCVKKGALQWFFWNEGLSMFEAESPSYSGAAFLETTPTNFAFNPFTYKAFTTNYAKQLLIAQPVHNFYRQEPIASNSQTRAECSLFLGQETNFVFDN